MVEPLRKRALRDDNLFSDDPSENYSRKLKFVKKAKSGDKENEAESGDPLPRGLYNESNTCYLNSLIQVLFHLQPFRDLVFRLTQRHHSAKVSVLEALQWLFIDLEEGAENNEMVTTNRLTKAFGWTSINRGLQQDIHEFMQTLFNSMEKELNLEDFQTFSSIFTGKMQRRITCEKVGYDSCKSEDVRGLSLPTISFMNIERSLDDVFKSEQIQMTIDGHGKQDAEMRAELVESPKVLLLTLNRLKYDPTEQAVIKVTDYFEYQDRLELCGHVYRLHSAVVHEGTAESGHYYCYISPTCNKKWCMFNDADVTYSDAGSAVRDNYGKRNDATGPTAYLVTYIREDCTEFFKPCTTEVPEKLRERINSIRKAEKARLEHIQTFHLYTTVSVLPWAMLESHTGYDVCDRLRVDKLHKNGEGTHEKGISNIRILKTGTVEDLMAQFDSSTSQENARLWSFTDRQIGDGWSTHRPDRLIKDWSKTITVVSQMRCPFYIFVEKLGTDYHPQTIDEDELSLFVKVFLPSEQTLRLEHHLIISIDTPVVEFKSAICRLSNIDTGSNEVHLYQEHSSMSTERLHCDVDTSLCDAFGGQILRHGTVLIAEIIANATKSLIDNTDQTRAVGESKMSGEVNPDQGIIMEEANSKQDNVITEEINLDPDNGSTSVIEYKPEVGLSEKNTTSKQYDPVNVGGENSEHESLTRKMNHTDSSNSTEITQDAINYMRLQGNRVLVTWYNKNQSYLPSHTEGDFTLELYLDMKICDVIDRLVDQLKCGVRELQLYGARRDQGYPQLLDGTVYHSQSTENLLKLVYKQVQHSYLWRHSAVLYYEQLAMSIEELAMRYIVTCTYAVDDIGMSRSITLYPLKQMNTKHETQSTEQEQHLTEKSVAIEQPSTVEHLLDLANQNIKSARPLRLLTITSRRITKVNKPEHLISTILNDELRLEQIPESEEDVEAEFSKILASVFIDSAYLFKRGVATLPFLMVIDRTDTGAAIKESIVTRLNIKELWRDKIEFKLIIPNETSITLPDSRLSVRDWGNMAYDDDSEKIGQHVQNYSAILNEGKL